MEKNCIQIQKQHHQGYYRRFRHHQGRYRKYHLHQLACILQGNVGLTQEQCLAQKQKWQEY
uniref:Uncharacterized protein n=1 Tax=Rhizophora mucronata TaxID=61149 RepID=A0A2P2PI24_RHIMU